MWTDIPSLRASSFRNALDVPVLVKQYAHSDTWHAQVSNRLIKLTAKTQDQAKKLALGIFHELLRDTLGPVALAK